METTKEQGRGTGLGLATVYGIVKQNEGYVRVYSELGSGSRFEINLPRHWENPLPDSGRGPAAAQMGGAETILLVEDDAMVLRLNENLLKSFGCAVLSAPSPTRAIELADEYKGKIHLLLSDVVVPEMNGRELAMRLQKRLPDLKCLLISGYAADLTAKQGIFEKDFAFVQKPVSRERLATKIREVLDRM